jgi:hypothetical protein
VCVLNSVPVSRTAVRRWRPKKRGENGWRSLDHDSSGRNFGDDRKSQRYWSGLENRNCMMGAATGSC